MTFVLIHRSLSSKHQADVNRKGWGSIPGTAFMDAERGNIAAGYALGMLTPVAVLTIDDIDEVFELTNHIDANWTENDGVEAPSSEVRSTSVGDIVIDYDTGAAFICASFGWKSIENIHPDGTLVKFWNDETLASLRIEAEAFGDFTFDREAV